MSRSGCPDWATLEKLVAGKARSSRGLSGELIRKNGNTPARGNKVELILFGQQHELSD
jgi:hypothetical protein